MEKAKRVVKNTGFLYARMGITVFISLYVTRLILAALGIEDFGIYSVVAGMISMLVFLNGAMTFTTQRFMSYAQGEGDEIKQKKIFNVSVVLHLVIAILVVLLIEVVGYFLFQSVLKIPEERMHAAKIIFHFMAASTFFTIISVPYDAVINARENMLFVAVVGVAESLLKLAIAFYITYTHFDQLISYGLLMATLSILLLITRRVYCKKKYEEAEINLKLYYDKPLFIEMRNFAGWSLMGISSGMLSNYGQGIVLNMFFGPIVNAAQGVAAQVNGQLSAFSITMLKALNPLIGKSEGAGDRKLMLDASLIGGKISFFLMVLFFVPILIEMPYIFSLWLTEVPEYVIIFCQLLLIKSLVEQLFLTLATSISVVGNIKQYNIYTSILNLLPLPISYYLFHLGYPPHYLYIVFLLYAVTTSVVVVFFAKKECGLSIPFFVKNNVIRCILSFILIISITSIPSYLIQSDWLRLISVILLSFISFIIVIWFVGFSKKERYDLKEVIIDMLKKKSILLKK